MEAISMSIPTSMDSPVRNVMKIAFCNEIGLQHLQ